MAKRFNYIIQRHTSGPNNGNCYARKHDDWRDCGANNGVFDAFGNYGFTDIKDARREIDVVRRRYPTEAYRIIQIVA